ncbi:MAG TPA: hypothetical protein VFK39_15810 [Gemmatimonadaceae bacterium]|nr:hypothetical protein [Gemmatimonadaceae bacterium]
MPATNLFLKLDRPDVSVEEFAEAAQALLAVVREVAQEVAGDATALRWIIRELRAGSAVLEAEPEILDDALTPAVVERIMTAAGDGMRALEEDGVGRPAFFTDSALRSAKRLAGILAAGEVGTSTIRIGPVTVAPTQRVAANVDEIIMGKVKSIGAVEGLLVTVSKRDGYRFFVQDRVRDHRVECHFKDDLLGSVLKAFDKLVIVRGVVWSRKDGAPQRIDVRSFEVLENDAQLPRANMVRGILRGIEYRGEYD